MRAPNTASNVIVTVSVFGVGVSSGQNDGSGTRELMIGEPSIAQSRSSYCIALTPLKVQSGSDSFAGCNIGVITEGLEDALSNSHQ